MEFWYKFFTYLFYPFAPLYLFLRKIRKKEHSIRYKEKLSKINIPRGDGFVVWFHAASVGEAMSILPLIEKFDKDESVHKILITTVTLSSGQILEKKYKENKKIIHQFFPLDINNFVNTFLKHWTPNLCIFIDSEIWPNIIFQIKKRSIPLLLVNARITEKTFSRWKFVKNFSKKIFDKFDLCIVSNKETKKYLEILGAKNIKLFGNLKFSNVQTEEEKNLNPSLLKKIENRKIWCAASTHQPEEIFCAKAHLIIKKNIKNILTVIIPRHINRVQSICDKLSELNLKTALYSNFDELKDDTDILLIDTYGEVKKFYKISKHVFVGKSLIQSKMKDSGQNPIEPSRLGCKIFHGPYVNNFIDVYEYLNSLEITKRIESPEELSQSLVEELKNNTQKNTENIKKIENYGSKTLNDVLKEIKVYTNSSR